MTQHPPIDGDLDALLTYINERRNFDFRGYKRASLSRRIERRMQLVGADGYQRYMDILEANPGEFTQLFNTILINVTSFLRDREAWEVLASTVLPRILRTKESGEPIRAWSAGCATGEEAYSLAVIMAEALGEDRFRQLVKIYATDADSDALIQARQGRYAERDLLQAFGEQRSKRFFELEDGYGTFRPELRRSLIFGRHDLVQDPPISKIDLLGCRNTLMYFTSELQQRILTSFHFALNPSGYLFLGKSEALAGRMRLFVPVDARQHIFQRNGERTDSNAPLLSLPERKMPREPSRVADALVEQSPVAQLALDSRLGVLAANLQARRILSIGSAELGTTLQPGNLGLDLSELHGAVDQVIRERRSLTLSDVTYRGRSGPPVTFDVVLAPLEDGPGVVLAFVDVTRYRTLGDDLERSQRELESAYEELQSGVEELETTNEELQSTNEELETTNEELHSTNEELETMNEELQSTNEELETANVELRNRSGEVDELNDFLQSILGSLKSAVVVLGREMEVRAWNRQAEELWGLRTDEVHDQHFLNLDIGFPVETLRSAIRSCLAGRSDGVEMVEPAVNRRGRHIDVKVTVTCLTEPGGVSGVILLMDPIADGDGSAVSDEASSTHLH